MEKRKRMETAQTFIPASTPVQMGTDSTQMHRGALFAVAQAVIEHKRFLEQCGHDVTGLHDLESWLNQPINRSYGAGILSVSGQYAETATSSTGFDESGFERLLKAALNRLFPSSSDGAVVGIIDNVELVSKSNDARRVLERIRDTTLSLPGVKWVLCGALGIVRSSVSSPSLNGRISTPLEVAPVKSESIPELITARLNYYAEDVNAKSPVGVEEFQHLYQICNENLRDAMKYAQAFCVWLDIEDELGKHPGGYLPLLEVWLAHEAEQILSAISLQPRAWKLFADLAAAGGSCAPGDNEQFDFNTPQQMRTNFSALERVDLVRAVVDEDDQRRKTVNITDKGWIVQYARSNFSA
ncbi:hypothetical protein [Curtobacterium sp. MCBD17_028]|uniref:hypothetical protein n=1 Tax=Curtobacterium sp. MCBD17_028 TaxID=2175670 RepID=UPI0011B41384|nr:hypothetical protein [Curtobacterium sp. MCBD17_028]